MRNFGEQALSLLDKISQGKLQIVAPELILYEVSNAIKSSYKSGKISLKESKFLIKKVIELNFSLVDFNTILEQSFDIAAKYDISIYDASYVAAAKSQKDFILYCRSKVNREVKWTL